MSFAERGNVEREGTFDYVRELELVTELYNKHALQVSVLVGEGKYAARKVALLVVSYASLLISFVGNNHGVNSNSQEANLDIQCTTSLTFPLANNFYNTGGSGYLVPDNDEPTQTDNQNEPYLEQLLYLLNLDDNQLPHTLTTSYGEDEQSVPANYSQKYARCSDSSGFEVCL